MPHSDWRSGPRVPRSLFSHQRKSSSRLEVPVLIIMTLSLKGAGGSPWSGCDFGFGGPLRPSMQKDVPFLPEAKRHRFWSGKKGEEGGTPPPGLSVADDGRDSRKLY